MSEKDRERLDGKRKVENLIVIEWKNGLLKEWVRMIVRKWGGKIMRDWLRSRGRECLIIMQRLSEENG
jgi:hypothetical protein